MAALLILYSGTPAATNARLGGRTYAYHYASVALGDELPAEINIADVMSEVLDEQDLLDAMRTVAPRPLDVAPIESAVTWDLIRLSPALRRTRLSRRRSESSITSRATGAGRTAAHPRSHETCGILAWSRSVNGPTPESKCLSRTRTFLTGAFDALSPSSTKPDA